VGKRRHKEKLKLAGLDDSDSSALTQSGDEMGGSSPPPQDLSRPDTEAGTEVGEEDAKMAEHLSPGELFATLLAHLLTPHHITSARPETHKSQERSQARCIYAYSFRCGCCVL
jgi:hypothetical protein